MSLPIQTAPIDRANRAINARASSRDVTPQAFDAKNILPTICAICKIFPKIPFCPILCPT
jgi:hypothetical protein